MRAMPRSIAVEDRALVAELTCAMRVPAMQIHIGVRRA